MPTGVPKNCQRTNKRPLLCDKTLGLIKTGYYQVIIDYLLDTSIVTFWQLLSGSVHSMPDNPTWEGQHMQ